MEKDLVNREKEKQVKEGGTESLVLKVSESLCWKRGAWLSLGVWCWQKWRVICACNSPPCGSFTRPFKAFTQFPKASGKLKVIPIVCENLDVLNDK